MTAFLSLAERFTFIFFILLFIGGVFQFVRALKKEGVHQLLITVIAFCVLNLLTMLLAVYVISGLGALLYIYMTMGSLLLFSLVSVFLLIVHSGGANKEKFWVGIAASGIPILSLIFIWIFLNAQGPIKFWS